MNIPNTCSECGYYSAPHDCGHPDLDGEVDVLAHDEPPYLDEVCDAVRHIIKYRNEVLYLVVVVRDGMPYEIFVEHQTPNKDELTWMMAGWDSNTRFISRSLKKEPLNWVVRQLERSTRKEGKDLPGIITDKLKAYL